MPCGDYDLPRSISTASYTVMYAEYPPEWRERMAFADEMYHAALASWPDHPWKREDSGAHESEEP